MRKVVAAVVAHPDDEILGCGATLAKHSSLGDEVYVLILAEGLTSRDSKRNREIHAQSLDWLSHAAKKANDVLGVNTLFMHDFPDNRMDALNLLDVVKIIEAFFLKYRPSRVYTHHHDDVNVDHRITHQAVMTATRPIPGQCIKELLTFETMSSSEWQFSGDIFRPNYYEDISIFLEKKMLALQCYENEMRPWPHSRSYEALEALAKYRGASVGLSAAEAFYLCRGIYE